MTDSANTPNPGTTLLDKITNFLIMGTGIACVTASIPKALQLLMGSFGISAAALSNVMVATALVLIGFIGGGILGIRLGGPQPD